MHREALLEPQLDRQTLDIEPRQEHKNRHKNGDSNRDENGATGATNGVDNKLIIHDKPAGLAHLPTFPIEEGWREVYDPETGITHRTPLTLLDILYPTEDDIGVVYMSQSKAHADYIRWLTSMLEAFLKTQEWLFLSDVLIHWGYHYGVSPKAPDIAVIPGGFNPPKEASSYRVGRDGPLPVFVVEITSTSTRNADLTTKPMLYASVGIKEYLIIDRLPQESDTWVLIGYRLEEDSPYYQQIDPNPDGSLTFETVGLRFLVADEDQVNVYDATTGKQLLTPELLQAYADQEAARADKAEAEAKRLAADLAEAMAELARLRGH